MSKPEMILIILSSCILLIIIYLVFTIIKNKKDFNQTNLEKAISIVLYQQQLELSQKSNQLITEQMEQTRKHVEERIGDLSDKNIEGLTRALKELGETQNKFKDIEITILKTVNEELSKINLSVEKRLESGFEQTTTTFTNVMERLAAIDNAQTNIELLSKEIIQLQDILQDKTKRGNFGEYQLNTILEDIFGVTSEVYGTQYTFSNGSRVDAIIFMPEEKGHIGIDSKFPLENYQRLHADNISQAAKEDHEKEFKKDVERHISAISRKYIIEGETIGYAIMFIPSEAIFYYILSSQPSLVTFAEKNRVALASPTTLIATLKVIQITLLDYKRRQNTNRIIEELKKLSIEFGRYTTRWGDVKKAIDKAKDESEKLNITNNKIIQRFESIERMDRSPNLIENESSE